MSDERPVIAFRADASVQIGTGHVMRCLTLADALRAEGAECHFLCRDLPGNLSASVRDWGHACHLLPAPDELEDDGATEHSAWLGVTRARDADESRAVLEPLRPDWLVVDHYALDDEWERALRPVVTKLMAIDDVADRIHDCNLLLDQNLGRASSDYDGLVPAACERLIGPHYALLRSEFRARRAESLAHRTNGHVDHMLVSLGGVDQDNVTGDLLDALSKEHLPAGCRITVVLGSSAPWKKEVSRQVAAMSVPAELRIGVSDMAGLMAEADLAIGAAGSSAWERCCLGLPTLLLVVAGNQVGAARALEKAGAAIHVTSDRAALHEGLRKALADATSPLRLTQMSEAAAGLVDGEGAPRVSRRIADKVVA